MSTETRNSTQATRPTMILTEPKSPTETTARQLTEEAGSFRTLTRGIAEKSAEYHKHLSFKEWQNRTNQRGRQAPKALLEEIAELGFAWRHIASMMDVSVPAVQKWRRSGGITGENRRHLASILALCDMITECYPVEDIASWFEMPISSLAPVTPIDLFSEGRLDLVLEYANGHESDSEKILTDYDPDWRDRYSSVFEVYRDSDGEMSIRPKDA
ncbi:hypothetical protein [Streptomyces sp. LaPpAH-108]|uniref:hypothetical protein n=1 Tax=Streptomyces sp. LaPpAH-108 TaxID=1155714 RepID=UPI001F360DE6|nr:hypothetical protein [Streptomyces sp. LaPpAH-108]